MNELLSAAALSETPRDASLARLSTLSRGVSEGLWATLGRPGFKHQRPGRCLTVTSGGTLVDCGIAVDSYELSPAISTVGIVSWSATASIDSAQILFGPSDTGLTMAAPVDLSEPGYRTLLLGMKSERDYSFQIVASSAGQTCSSETLTLSTGYVANALPNVDREIIQEAAISPGFIVTTTVTSCCPTTTFCSSTTMATSQVFGNGVSHAVEFALDLEALTATEVFHYVSADNLNSGALGDVQRLPNGNTLVTYSNSGVIHEVDPAGMLVQAFKTEALGYAMHRESLYGPPPK